MGKRLRASSSRGSAALLRIPWIGLGTKHDESGQVYTEVSCQGGTMIANWKWKTSGSALQYRTFRSRDVGCSSLYDMSMRSCLFNSMDITSDGLEEIPETIGLALWKNIVTAKLDSVQLFTEFAQRYSSAIGRKYHVISTPNLPLVSYFKDITSPNYQWITCLTLLNVTIPRTALIQASWVTNLVALAVGPNVLAPDIGVDDSLIRTWSRSTSTGAFHSLRVLVLREQDHVTPRTFEYLASFPALAVFGTNSVRGSGLMDRNIALKFGWKHKANNNASKWQGSGADRSHWDESLLALFKLAGKVDTDSLSSEKNWNLDMLPVVHLAIGGYGSDTNVAKLGGGPMHLWNRQSKTDEAYSESKETFKLPEWSSGNDEIKYQRVSYPSNASILRKRAHDPTEIRVAKKAAKTVLRTSKTHNIGDLLSEFVS